MNFIERLVALLLLILGLPIWIVLFLIVKTASDGPFLFRQLRLGKNKKPFIMYKVRTMTDDAEKLKEKYLRLNEADSPLFKIRDDPRFTKIGKLLSRSSIDEIPQLINILKGEMTFVGPRPFPINEANKIPNKYKGRFAVLPGMTSKAIVKGAHKMTFSKWMEMDLEYIDNKSIRADSLILSLTLYFVLKGLISKLSSPKLLL